MKLIGEGDFTPERIRLRTCMLCLGAIRNIAYLRAYTGLPAKTFHNTVLSNFIDIATLEWCKVFADINGKHYWKKTLEQDEVNNILSDMLKQIGITIKEYEDYIDQIKKYRDKFVAHLDEKNRMDIPDFDIGLKVAQYLYQYLTQNKNFPPQTPTSEFPEPYEYYESCFYDSKKITEVLVQVYE